LRQAMTAKTDSEMHDHLTAALFFRSTRYSLFPEAATSENLLELNEGMAEYTGTMMSARNDGETEKYLEARLVDFLNNPTFVRSFAYITTPLYGFILQHSERYWNKKISGTTNLTGYFTNAFNVTLPVSLCAECISQYGSEKIMAEEIKRDEEKAERIATFRSIFIVKPHLTAKLENMRISFDPRNLVPLEGYGTVYPTMRISDNWGILSVTGGALVGSNWDKVTLGEPDLITPNKVSGNGWVLDLNNRYIVEKDSTDGNYLLKKR